DAVTGVVGAFAAPAVVLEAERVPGFVGEHVGDQPRVVVDLVGERPEDPCLVGLGVGEDAEEGDAGTPGAAAGAVAGGGAVGDNAVHAEPLVAGAAPVQRCGLGTFGGDIDVERCEVFGDPRPHLLDVTQFGLAHRGGPGASPQARVVGACQPAGAE